MVPASKLKMLNCDVAQSLNITVDEEDKLFNDVSEAKLWRLITQRLWLSASHFY